MMTSSKTVGYLYRSGAWRLYRACINLRLKNPVRILSAHRVIDAAAQLAEDDRRDLKRGCLSLAAFERAIQHLHANYTFFALDRYVAALQCGQKLPQNSVILTFDDGSEDVYANAYPILKTRDIPFTVFLTTAWIDRQAGIMTSRQVQEMASDPSVSWGAHGATHAVLSGLDRKGAAREITQSLRRVAELTGRATTLFCYPDGRYTHPIQGFLAQQGVTGACATGRRLNSGAVDRMALQRIPFEEESLGRFVLRVAGRA